MAVVDLDQNKIVGAKKGSPVWWHEKGHIEFNKSDKGIKYSYYVSYLMGVSVFFIMTALFFNQMKYFALISVLMMFYYYAYEEVWCWIYAYKKLKKNKNKLKEVKK